MYFRVPMFKQSDGTPSASFTMVAVAFGLISLWLLVSIVESIAGLDIREFNGAEAMAYFTPLAALYFGRRWTAEMGQEKATKLLDAVRGTANSLRPPPPSSDDDSEK